jgi:hypothetical protein
VSSNDAYAPKHRALREPAVKRGVKKGVLLSGIAVATTGVAVGGGVLYKSAPPAGAAASLASATYEQSPAPVTSTEDRKVDVSRSDRRTAVDQTKARSLSQESGGQVTRTRELASGDPRDIARAMLAEFGWSQSQFGCLDALFTRESGWRTTAANPSGAYGIPQALPGSKMASEGPDWRYNPETQIRWGMGYISARYGSPCGAWGHSQASGWY